MSPPTESLQSESVIAVAADPTPAEIPVRDPVREVEPESTSAAAGDDFAAVNEFNWMNLLTTDRQLLLAPRNYPCPCPWCGGRLHHNPLCDDLRASWQLTMPFGKHAGKPLAAVPRDYLEWLVSQDGLDAKLRTAIDQQMKPEQTT